MVLKSVRSDPSSKFDFDFGSMVSAFREFPVQLRSQFLWMKFILNTEQQMKYMNIIWIYYRSYFSPSANFESQNRRSSTVLKNIIKYIFFKNKAEKPQIEPFCFFSKHTVFCCLLLVCLMTSTCCNEILSHLKILNPMRLCL